MDVNADQAIGIFEGCIRHNLEVAAAGYSREDYLNPFAEGEPGCGKTTAARAAATNVAKDVGFLKRISMKLFGLENTTFISRTIILAQYESTDLGGLPWEHDGKMIRLRPEVLPESGLGMIFFDECRKAKPSTHNVMGQILLEGRVGEHRISPGFTIFLASNERKDRAGDIELPSHVLDRSLLFRVVTHRDAWLKYAQRSGFHELVIFFVKSNPNYFNSHDEGELIHPTPRSYEQVSSILKIGQFNHDKTALRAAIEGKLGRSAGHALYSFASLRDKLPDPDYVLAHPMDVKIPTDSQTQYAMMAAVSGVVQRETTPGLKKFLERFDKEVPNGMELSAFVIQSIQSRSRRILTTAAGVELVGSYHGIVEGSM